jgi:hypothetical protein
VPGIAALNKGDDAGTTAVSCPSARNCEVAGTYKTLVRKKIATRPFVENETNGAWGKAQEVPGLTALDVTFTATISSLSCASAGNCSAGGQYERSGSLFPFVVSETSGTWGSAQYVPDATGSTDPPLSCASATHCVAGGSTVQGNPAQGGTVTQAIVIPRT